MMKIALKEMHRQVGDLQIDEKGVARRGLLVRHLVLPNNLAGSKKIFEFIAKEISKNTFINIMDQYRPCFKASELKELDNQSLFKEINIGKVLSDDMPYWVVINSDALSHFNLSAIIKIWDQSINKF